MKNLKPIFVTILLFVFHYVNAQEIAQWRGINRDGVYNEQNLLKSWPENGPEIRWVNEDIGDGFGSPTVTDDMIYVNGKVDSLSYTFAIDLNGKIVWKTPNGNEFTGREYSANFPGSRSAPTVLKDFIYVSSANGRIACLEKQTGKEIWSVDMIRDFNGVKDQHGYCESLVVDDKNVYCLPGGITTNVAALDRFTGKTVWTAKAFSDSATYCSPMIINLPSRNILVNFSGHYLLGFDCKTGELLWSQRQAYHFYHQHCNTPIFDNGSIYYISGEGNGAVKLELSANGNSIKDVWRNNDIKNVFLGFVKIGDHIFSPDNSQKLKCIDTNTGQVTDSIRLNKGGIIYADSMLYCYSDNGNVNLIRLNGTNMEIVSKFKCDKGTKEHFAHPVIKNGVLYLRHGRALIAYNIKQ